MPERAYERAGEVQQMLTEGGIHRSAGPVDLLMAATAERERLTVLCDDRDLQTIARLTGQPVKLVNDIYHLRREHERIHRVKYRDGFALAA